MSSPLPTVRKKCFFFYHIFSVRSFDLKLIFQLWSKEKLAFTRINLCRRLLSFYISALSSVQVERFFAKKKKDNLGQLTQIWVGGVRWSQTVFMAYLTPLLLKNFGKFTVNVPNVPGWDAQVWVNCPK